MTFITGLFTIYWLVSHEWCHVKACISSLIPRPHRRVRPGYDTCVCIIPILPFFVGQRMCTRPSVYTDITHNVMINAPSLPPLFGGNKANTWTIGHWTNLPPLYLSWGGTHVLNVKLRVGKPGLLHVSVFSSSNAHTFPISSHYDNGLTLTLASCFCIL